MKREYQHKITSVFLLNYHFVFCPKRRRKILIGALRDRLIALLNEKSLELDWQIIALKVMADHVHLFIGVDPSTAPDQVMFRLKGYTARVLRSEFPHLLKMPSLWTRSYFVSTAGNVSGSVIERYIAQQTTRD